MLAATAPAVALQALVHLVQAIRTLYAAGQCHATVPLLRPVMEYALGTMWLADAGEDAVDVLNRRLQGTKRKFCADLELDSISLGDFPAEAFRASASTASIKDRYGHSLNTSEPCQFTAVAQQITVLLAWRANQLLWYNVIFNIKIDAKGQKGCIGQVKSGIEQGAAYATPPAYYRLNCYSYSLAVHCLHEPNTAA